MDKNKKYSEYLKTRSKLSYFYRHKILYPKLNKSLEGTTLDVGCGIGDFLSFKKDAIGIDINTELVEICKTKGLNACIMEENKIPFGKSSFDSVVLDNVLEHIDNPKKIIQEIKRVLKRNKILIIGVPGKFGYTKDDDHKIFYSKYDLVKLLSNYSFKLEKIFGMPVNINFLENFLRQYCVYGIFRNYKD